MRSRLARMLDLSKFFDRSHPKVKDLARTKDQRVI